MNFLAPGWLWLILTIPILYVYILWDERKRRKQFELFAAQGVWQQIAPEIDLSARLKKSLLWLGAVLFILLALARPQWGSREETAKMTGLDIMTVLDVSNSMETEDVVPSRLKKSKHLIRNLAEKLEGDRLGLVVFAGGASVATPLTTDIEYFLESLEIQGPKMIATQGTDIGLGLETALRAMERGAVNSAAQSSDTIPSRAIILITDGEDFGGAAREAAAKVKTEGVRLYIFGVGTEKGGPVPIRDDSGSLGGYKRDHSGKPVVSSFHPDDLVQLAATAGGRYWNVTADEGEADDLLKDIGALSRGDFAEHRYIVYEERFQYPLAVAIFLLFLETSLLARRKRVTSSVVAILMLGFTAFSAHATGIDTYRENKKGVEAYKAGKTEDAQKSFGAAQALDPELPELQYNQGLVHMQQGDTDTAVRDFQQAARGAMKTGDSKLMGQTFFNMGAAMAKKQDLKAAVQSYLAAINSAAKTGDSQLEHDARKNIELLVNEQQKQQQQQKQQDQKNKDDQQKQQQDKPGQGKGEGDKKDQKPDDKKSDDPGKDKNKDENKDQEQKEQQKKYDNESSRGKKFESQKLTAEDAERVMAELKSRENELQKSLKKQNGTYTSENKDW